VVFGSPIVADGLVVAGVGSYEVFAPGDPPRFRGHVVALDAATGTEAWHFWVTAGDASEGPGVPIWSSPLTIEQHRSVVQDGRGRMPGWAGSLSAEEIEAVVEYERTVLSRGGG
jgi:outer membrane protein assembly factor BamB